jgi:hypothetical protein
LFSWPSRSASRLFRLVIQGSNEKRVADGARPAGRGCTDQGAVLKPAPFL